MQEWGKMSDSPMVFFYTVPNHNLSLLLNPVTVSTKPCCISRNEVALLYRAVELAFWSWTVEK